jgi:hypothetical protein
VERQRAVVRVVGRPPGMEEGMPTRRVVGTHVRGADVSEVRGVEGVMHGDYLKASLSWRTVTASIPSRTRISS